MLHTLEFWTNHAGKSGNQLGREFGDYGRTWRKRIAKAKILFPQLDWGVDTPSVPPTVHRGIAVFDLHFPDHDVKMWNNILRFAKDFKPDTFVFGGDNMDLQVVSHWVGDAQRKVEGMRLSAEYDGFNEQILAPLEKTLAHNARKIFHYGNHEDWVERYIDCHPEVEGFFEIENNLDIDDWEIYPYGKSSNVGKLHIIHGVYTNIHHAYKTAQVYGRNIMYGHIHTEQSHTIVAPLDTHPHKATSIGCACNTNPHYARNKPNAWSTGFAVFYTLPDGNFALYPINVIDGVFVAPDGTIYE